jgi:hypothetical protein
MNYMNNVKKKLNLKKIIKKVSFMIGFIVILLGLLSYIIAPFFI